LNSEYFERIVGPDDIGRRLDRILRVVLMRYPLSFVYSTLRSGKILLNGKKAKPDQRIIEGDSIFFDNIFTAASIPLHPRDDAELAPISGFLILATKDLLFLNKPRGMLVHGQESLEELVRKALAERSAQSLSFSPGPLHRLDRNTSGLVVFPRSANGARAFTDLLRRRKIRKRYIAVLEGEMVVSENWSDRIVRDRSRAVSHIAEGGALAKTSALPLIRAGGCSLAVVEIETGLTHQIRIQTSSHGFPLAGDLKYGGNPFFGGYILHALSLDFSEPPFSDVPSRVVARLPGDAKRSLDSLFGAEKVESCLRELLAT
jgi:23S rRNA pseudouridine955/2504/2580 synthase